MVKLKHNAKYSSFQELSKAIEDYESEEDMKLRRNGYKDLNFDDSVKHTELKYEEISYICSHKFKEIDNSECLMSMLAKKNGNFLQVKINLPNHNHQNGKFLHDLYVVDYVKCIFCQMETSERIVLAKRQGTCRKIRELSKIHPLYIYRFYHVSGLVDKKAKYHSTCYKQFLSDLERISGKNFEEAHYKSQTSSVGKWTLTETHEFIQRFIKEIYLTDEIKYDYEVIHRIINKFPSDKHSYSDYLIQLKETFTHHINTPKMEQSREFYMLLRKLYEFEIEKKVDICSLIDMCLRNEGKLGSSEKMRRSKRFKLKEINSDHSLQPSTTISSFIDSTQKSIDSNSSSQPISTLTLNESSVDGQEIDDDISKKNYNYKIIHNLNGQDKLERGNLKRKISKEIPYRSTMNNRIENNYHSKPPNVKYKMMTIPRVTTIAETPIKIIRNCNSKDLMPAQSVFRNNNIIQNNRYRKRNCEDNSTKRIPRAENIPPIMKGRPRPKKGKIKQLLEMNALSEDNMRQLLESYSQISLFDSKGPNDEMTGEDDLGDYGSYWKKIINLANQEKIDNYFQKLGIERISKTDVDLYI
ncbi:hypothetical protein SNEBB_010732 [Seison nebaliae]|nr:hypothetical protein SNEBB_010732 [Seison nebaliae]